MQKAIRENKMITTQWDEYLQERYENKPRWQVVLSNGQTVYQDDERYGESSWRLLRTWLLLNEGIQIVSMFVGFRDNVHSLPDNADGYFFRNSVMASFDKWEKHSFIIGTLSHIDVHGVNQPELTVWKYDLPEMICMGEEKREIDTAGESLILCKKNERVLT